MKKSERLNQELIYLSHRSQFQLKDLMTEFDISKRTALRDLEELETMGLALYAEPGRGGGYRLLKQDILTPIYFSQSELTAIHYALEALGQMTSSPFDKSYPQIRQKLLARLSDQQREQITKTLAVIDYYQADTLAPAPYLDHLVTSILEHKAIQLVYQQKEELKLTLQVANLTFRQGIWFFNGYDLDRQTWQIHRADAIKTLELVEDQRLIPSEELQASLQTYEANYFNIPYKCHITPQGQEHFKRNHYRDMQVVEENGRTYLLGHYHPSELHYMVHYLIGYGKEITILEPKELKEAYMESLKDILKRY